MTNKIILTGLHKCGKSTFISKICSNHALSSIRLNTDLVMKKGNLFDISTYLNFFNVYDRFLFIDLFVFYRFSENAIIDIFKELKPILKDSIFVFGLFSFEEDWRNYDVIKERFEIIIKILKSLNYKVKVFYDKKHWISYVDKFNPEKIDHNPTSWIPNRKLLSKELIDHLKTYSEIDIYFDLMQQVFSKTYLEGLDGK